MITVTTISHLYSLVVPSYKSQVYRPFIARVTEWDGPKNAPRIRAINPERAHKRCVSYLDPFEIARVRRKLESKKDASVRFGHEKSGRGYHGERGDFCLVGGAIDGRNLSLFYRSLELIGGFGYDIVLIEDLRRRLKLPPWKAVTFFSPKANVFALKRNSNEKLYPKLLEIFHGKN